MSLLVRLRHTFPGFSLDVAFEAPSPGVTVLFGPSGAGKSSIVAAVAGLLQPREGHVAVDGTVLSDSARGTFLPPERRRLGMVFQDARLFPHLSVARNLTYGMRRAPPGPIRLADVVELLGIGHLLDRRPRALSGGERQRVAIGRALLSQPRLLLMDEPLASLDAARKAEILPYLSLLRGEMRLPILYVTHALEEAAQLGDTLVLIEAGRVLAAGKLGDVAARADLPLASRDDAASFLSAHVVAHEPARALSRVAAGGQSLLVPLLDAPPGTPLRLRVLAREVILATETPRAISVHNVLACSVAAIVPDAAHRAMLVELEAAEGAGRLLARITGDAVERLGLRAGGEVLALVKSMSVETLPG